jgi:predicted AlkP superfamily pyrophosphatase or phosphodiesterase
MIKTNNCEKTLLLMQLRFLRNTIRKPEPFGKNQTGGMAIQYLIPEYWPQGDSQSVLEAFAEGGSSPEVQEIIQQELHGAQIRRHPETDDFILRCTCSILRRFQPDLLMLHPGNVDGYRHAYGVFNDKVEESVRDTMRYLAQIMETLEQTEQKNVYNVVLTSDHGLIDVKRVINLNVLLRQAGMIRTNANGSWISWDACCVSGGTSALVYLSPDAPPECKDRVYTLLKELENSPDSGVGEILAKEDAEARYHLAGPFSFVVETDGITSFGDGATGDLLSDYDITDYRYGRATHGHQPDKGPQPIFCAVGPDFKQDVWLDTARLVDEAPTWASVLGLTLPGTDGVPLEQLLKKLK